MTADLRLGRWEDALANVERCDLVCVDAPYSKRTHIGHRKGAGLTGAGTPCQRRDLGYDGWSDEHVGAFVSHWSPRCDGWLLSVTDHNLAPVWEAALQDAGRYVFAPIPLVDEGSRVRMAGDGPTCWATWLIASRPRTMKAWGSLPGAYIRQPGDERSPVMGGKPLGVMRAIIRDYSRRGDLIVDPCAGGATTLLAAVTEGRRAIGAEMDPATFDLAVKRLCRGYTPCFDFAEAAQ